MRQFRIVHTESSLGWGGQEQRVLIELRWMKKRGHEVWLVAHPQSEVYRRAGQEDIPLLPLTFRRSAWPREIKMFFHFLKSNRIQIVNTHSSRDAWLAGIIARFARVPCILRTRHIEVEYALPYIARIAFEFIPHHVLTTSSQIIRRLQNEVGINPERLSCISTGIDLTRFHPLDARPLRNELNLANNVFLAGMVSVLRSWKGHDDFLEAAYLLIQKKLPVHFVIVGEGSGRALIEEKIRLLNLETHVTLLGHREDIPQILASLDALVLPSTAHEGIPQIILQAQAMARPVIGTRVGGIPEVIRHGETGFLIPPHDPPALADAISHLFHHRDEAAEAGRRALLGIAPYSLEAMGEKLERIYNQYLPS